MIMGQSVSGDYVVLPISTIPVKSKVNPVYDIPLDMATYSFLNSDSYLRTHKQTVVNIASLKDQLSDFKVSYADTYCEALIKVQQFQDQLILDAIL